VIASDGVWEFLSNKQVCDMVEPFYINNNVNGACDKIVDESYKRWRKEGMMVDDITCVVIFFTS